MDALSLLQQVEALYRQILGLTLRQEAILDGGNAAELPAIVSEKFALLDRAQALLGKIGPDEDRNAPVFQKAVEGLRAVLAEVVASEDRCKALAPAPRSTQPPPPARAVAAYGRR